MRNSRFISEWNNFKLVRIIELHEKDAFYYNNSNLVGQLAWISEDPKDPCEFSEFHSGWATFITGIYAAGTDLEDDCFFRAVKYEVL